MKLISPIPAAYGRYNLWRGGAPSALAEGKGSGGNARSSRAESPAFGKETPRRSVTRAGGSPKSKRGLGRFS